MGTLLSHLLAIAGSHPKKTALQFGSERVSYESLVERIHACAFRLRSRGVVAGDRVLICGANTPAIAELYFAVHALGAVSVPLPPDTPAGVLAQLAADAEARAAVLEKQVPGMACLVLSTAEMTAPGTGRVEPAAHDAAIADLLYTTGTTGRKKGVVLTHANVLAAAQNIAAFIGTTANDVEVMPLPLSHSFGLGRLRSLAVTGNTLVLEPGVGTGAQVVKRILDLRATGLALVPAGFDILKRMTGDVLGKASDHLRYIEIGSAPMKAETREWLKSLLPRTRICHHYGLTEASRAAFTEYHGDAHKPGTAGRAAPNVRISICDEADQPLPSGQVGEVVVSGGMVMREYWKQPELTARVLSEKGLKTGDIGYLDEDGYLFLVGRKSDLINVGGRKVAPDEIEELLCQMEGVWDAGCIGEPDDLLGERVRAYVVSDREIPRSEIVAYLRPRLEESKIPQVVTRVERIPRTGSGKIQRQALRQENEMQAAARSQDREVLTERR